MKDSEIYDAAADEVLKGWHQGSYENNEGSVCAIGALRRVQGISTSSIFADLNMNTDVFTDLLGHFHIPTWNDEPGRTAGEVADAFRTCAKILRERGE